MSARDLRRRLSTAGLWALDALLALAAAGFGVVALAPVLPLSPGQPRTVAAYALLLAHSLPIALRRRFPVQVLGCGLATGLAFASLGSTWSRSGSRSSSTSTPWPRCGRGASPWPAWPPPRP